MKWGKQKIKQTTAQLVNSLLTSNTLEADPSIFKTSEPILKENEENEENLEKPKMVQSGVIDEKEIQQKDKQVFLIHIFLFYIFFYLYYFIKIRIFRCNKTKKKN